ncbi:MAG TPA: bifunctional phosphoribosyl-AMP cyclohydrolase/phosphoribosyl-ATP diphosphatase HisIE [Candidatus Limnocylindrales bacterium]|nr:bifunctional phosphoribosyl-AMP cyclohydrolase/phosphoribosyl-ATP diphosphatase HisIE [Candidatus Limnocylindrales bacterium]
MTAATRPGPVGLAAGLDPAAVCWDRNDLVVGVVQDVADGRVLMVGWLDVEALAATLGTGDLHFHSRSRARLWRKGESSGNVLRLRGLALDCDGDALLLTAEPAGPTCHRETRSCFDPDAISGAVPGIAPVEIPALETGPAPQGFGWLESLWATITERARTRAEGSYTVRLLGGGVDLAGRKVVEEATEVLLAAKNDETAEVAGADRTSTQSLLAGEAGDLLYHALVLLAERQLEPQAVLDVLRSRHGVPGRG